MIDKHSIRQKDFSVELPSITGKLHFLSLSLASSENLDGMPEGDIMGAGDIILDIAADLQIMNEVLYGEKHEAPETDSEGGTARGQKGF